LGRKGAFQTGSKRESGDVLGYVVSLQKKESLPVMLVMPNAECTLLGEEGMDIEIEMNSVNLPRLGYVSGVRNGKKM
jgi:hypothetical protein